MDESVTVQHAAFLVPLTGGELRLAVQESSERLRCASLLKPLVFWAARHVDPFTRDPGRWQQLAGEGVRISANEPTVQAWELCGQDRLLTSLSDRTGVRFSVQPGGQRPFGRMLVSASVAARAYAALGSTDDPAAEDIREWMRAVPEPQTFGVRQVFSDSLDVPVAQVAVKCGWFMDADETRIRTHAAALVTAPEGLVGAVVLTAIPLGEPDRRRYGAVYNKGAEVLPIHEAIAGPVLRAAIGQALADLGDRRG